MARSRSPSESGAFAASDFLRAQARAGEAISAQAANEIRLLVSGESVVDWHRLELADLDDARRLLALNAIELEDEQDRLRLESLRNRAAVYVEGVLKLRVPKELRETSVPEILLLASGSSRLQRHACVLLKVMHVIYHLDARELRTRLSISDNELFGAVETSVTRMFDELRGAGVPVSEFAWSRKTQDSLITKLMIKRRNSAARIFDRLRFRVVVEDEADLIPTLHVLLRRCIPFNYVVPAESVNRLVPSASLEQLPGGSPHVDGREQESEESIANEFSDSTFRVLNFVADLPVRVEEFAPPEELASQRGRVVFVLTEFQVLDRASAHANEQGPASHQAYKTRQHTRVKERMLRVPHGRPEPSSPDPESDS